MLVLQNEKHVESALLSVLLPFHGQTSGTLGQNSLYAYSAQEITALHRLPHFSDCDELGNVTDVRPGPASHACAAPRPARRRDRGSSATSREGQCHGRMRATRTGPGRKSEQNCPQEVELVI